MDIARPYIVVGFSSDKHKVLSSGLDINEAPQPGKIVTLQMRNLKHVTHPRPFSLAVPGLGFLTSRPVFSPQPNDDL